MDQLWPTDGAFLSNCQQQLFGIFRQLGCEIDHHVFLIAVPRDGGPIRLYPPPRSLKESQFAEVVAPRLTIPVQPAYGNSGDDWFKANHDFNVALLCLQETISSTLELLLGKQFLTFSSECVFHRDFYVVIAAILGRQSYSNYPSLNLSAFFEHGRWPSLHFGVVRVILEHYAQELRKGFPASYHNLVPVDPRQALREAGSQFMRVNAWANKAPRSPYDSHLLNTFDLMDTCSVIAAAAYERKSGSGSMLIADQSSSCIDVLIRPREPFMVSDHRRVRKMLEMCGDRLSLLCDARRVWGLGTLIKASYEPARMDVLTVKFLGHGLWELHHLDERLMVVKDGEPSLPRPATDRSHITKSLRFVFPDQWEELRERFIPIVDMAASTGHGTTLVISADAENEAERLSGTTGILPVDLTGPVMKSASSIDGAILVDVSGRCHGIGVILDGEAKAPPNPERGARYNSAVRYCGSRKGCVAVVISDDGSVDVLPEPEIAPAIT